MALPSIRNQNIDGAKFSVAETAAALRAVSADIVEQEKLLIKYAKRTYSEKVIIKEICHRIKDFNRGEQWEITAAAELIYEQRARHLYAEPLAKIRKEKQQKKDRRKRTLTDKLKIRMLEIDKLKGQGATWLEIIKWLNVEHRSQFYKEKISVELIRHLYYDFKKQ